MQVKVGRNVCNVVVSMEPPVSETPLFKDRRVKETFSHTPKEVHPVADKYLFICAKTIRKRKC
jgi:hypothetical protein